MIRIQVTEEAYQAIAKTLPKRERAKAPEAHELGGVSLWLDNATLAALNRGRRAGESYSDVILRLARLEK